MTRLIPCTFLQRNPWCHDIPPATSFHRSSGRRCITCYIYFSGFSQYGKLDQRGGEPGMGWHCNDDINVQRTLQKTCEHEQHQFHHHLPSRIVLWNPFALEVCRLRKWGKSLKPLELMEWVSWFLGSDPWFLKFETRLYLDQFSARLAERF